MTRGDTAERDRELSQFDDDLRATHSLEWLAGTDEVGRGPLAGPVVACAVILPRGCLIAGADDSKALTAAVREALCPEIEAKALAVGWGIVRPSTIDRINILQASRRAMRRALSGLDPRAEAVVVDGWEVPRLGVRQIALPKADSKSLSVACASILAKVKRDRMMERYDRRFPVYDFAGNKGYATAAHLEALDRHGPCPVHRYSFTPVAQIRIPF